MVESGEENPMPVELIKTDGTKEAFRPLSKEKGYTLQELQKAVGGYIELVVLSGDTVMYLNEEGKIYDLPINEEATKLFREAHPNTNDYIVGNVIVGSLKELG